MTNFIEIEKYGCFYDPMTQETCPINADGTPDVGEFESGLHVDDITCDEGEGILEEIDTVMKAIVAAETIRHNR